MSQISVTDTVLSESRAQKPSVSRPNWLNSITAWLLVAIILLAPIPFGSARALYWEALAVLVGSIAVIYFAAAIVMREVPRISIVSIAPQAIAFAILCLWLLIVVWN